MQTWQLAVTGLASAFMAVLIVATRHWHSRWTGDFEDSGVQKHHVGAPPRVGILPILAGSLVALYFLQGTSEPRGAETGHLLMLILLSSLPVVVLGFADDLTKRISPLVRLVGGCAAALLAAWLLGHLSGGFVTRANMLLVDELLQWVPLAVAITVLMVAGFTNAMNIVDGLNGLSGGLCLLMLAATAAAAAGSDDWVVFNLCCLLGLAVLGFMLLNYPRGLMFLGDGGAYFLGFALVQVWLLLLGRNSEISTWFVVAVAAHPTMETIFSMYRRRIHRGRSGAFTAADRLHLHSLVYRRRLLPLLKKMPGLERWVANAGASSLLLLFGMAPMAAAAVSPTSTAWCVAVIAVYVVCYLVWFRLLVGFGRLRSQVAPESDATPATASTGTR